MAHSRILNLSRHLVNNSMRSSLRYFRTSNIIKGSSPSSFENELYWLRKMGGNRYAFGINQGYMEENGEPQMTFLEVDINEILMEGDSFAVLENEKAVITLEAPFDNAKLVEFDESIDFDVVNEDPENIDNRICVFEDVNIEPNLSSSPVSGDSNNNVYQMALL